MFDSSNTNQVYRERLSSCFGHIDSKLNSEKGLNYTTKLLEGWLTPIFNQIFDANFIIDPDPNFAAIDNHDPDKGLAIQVTRSDTNGKIKTTLLKFYKNDLHKTYKKLYFVFLKSDTNLKGFDINEFKDSTDFKKLDIPPDEWVNDLFNPKDDIFDFNTIIGKLTNIKTPTENLKIICEQLDNITGKIIQEAENYKHINNKGNSINDLLLNKTVDDSIDTLYNKFGPFKTIPRHIFINLKLYNEKIEIDVDNTTLITNNQSIISELQNDNTKLSKFLISNNIHSVRQFSNNAPPVKLISIGDKVNCHICDIINFKYLEGFPPDVTNNDTYEQNLIYLLNYLELGDINKAILLYNKLFDYCNDNQLRMHYAHLVYNFNSFYYHYLFNEDKEKNKKNLSERKCEIDTDLWVASMKYINLKECKDLIEHHLHFNHIENYRSLQKIITAYEDVIEDYNNGNDVIKIQNVVDDILYYIYCTFQNTIHNFIFFDLKYSNGGKVLMRAFKMLLHLYTINDKNQSIVLHDWLISLLLRTSLDSNELRKSLIKYQNSSLLVNNVDNIHKVVLKLLNNIIDVNKKYKLKKSYSHYGTSKSQINDTIENIIIFYLHIEFSESQINESISRIYNLYTKNSILFPITFRHINNLIFNLQEKLDKPNIDKFESLVKKHHSRFHKTKLLSNKNTGENFSIDETLELIINKKIKATPSFKRKYKAFIKKEFNFYYYKLGVLYELIKLEDFEMQAIDYLVNFGKNYKLFSSITNEYLFEKVDFIKLLYKFKIEASQEKYEVLIQGSDYINWMLNLGTYNQSGNKFNISWIYKNTHNSEVIYKEMAKHKYIIEAIENFLKTNHHKRLSAIYFNYFT